MKFTSLPVDKFFFCDQLLMFEIFSMTVWWINIAEFPKEKNLWLLRKLKKHSRTNPMPVHEVNLEASIQQTYLFLMQDFHFSCGICNIPHSNPTLRINFCFLFSKKFLEWKARWKVVSGMIYKKFLTAMFLGAVHNNFFCGRTEFTYFIIEALRALFSG